MNETMATTNNFLNIVLILIGVFDVLRQRLHDNDRIVKAKNRKVFCLQEFRNKSGELLTKVLV